MDEGHHCELGYGLVCGRFKGSEKLFIAFRGPGPCIDVAFCPKCGYSYQPERLNPETQLCRICKFPYEKEKEGCVCYKCRNKYVRPTDMRCESLTS